jgi:vancomycin resistance protein YoaR
MGLKEKNIEDEIINNIENPIETTSSEQAKLDEKAEIEANKKILDEPIKEFTSSTDETSLIQNPIKDFVPVYKQKSKSVLSIFGMLTGILIIIVLLILIVFTGYNMFNQNIVSGVSIKGVDVSNMSKSDAKYKLDNYLSEVLPQEIKVKHGDFEATLSTSQIAVEFDTKSATNQAFSIGRQGNIFENDFYVLSSMFGKTDINLNLKLDTDQLSKNLDEMSAQLPDKVTDSSYYIDKNNLIVTPGKTGNVVDVETSIQNIKDAILSLSDLDQPIELAVKTQEPEKIDIEKVHTEIYKEPKDAYYTQDPFTVYPSENGLDFKVSIEEANNILGDQSADEYTIPLKVLYPNVTTNMIGSEAFPDLLSSFSTKYSVRATARTTNLKLAASKINGTVLMPGETFSYNKVVGARTIAAGYKEAPIYVSGEVVDGLGGGICQITSTLYNAVVYANLDIVERTNHQFVPSYVTASRDATVVYGSLDFKFKNNRNYPIKINCSVSGGIANFQIFGLRQNDDYDVEISSYETGRTATAIYSEAYKILKKDGKVVNKQLLSKDTYKRH